MKNLKITVVITAIIMAFSMGYAQDHPAYRVHHGKVYFENAELRGSDPDSFTELGYGYAKDRFHVYMNGEILPFVNPFTFSVGPEYAPVTEHHPHREPGQQADRKHEHPRQDRGHDRGDRGRSRYTVIKDCVFFDGRLVSDASALSFVDLGQGYAKDAFEVYYMGNRIEGASVHSFTVLKDGYAKDAFSVWYRGQLVKD